MITVNTIGVIGRASKRNEKRVPIHPEHIEAIPLNVRKKLTFEEGYGTVFGYCDQTIAELTSGRVLEKKELLQSSDCIIVAKPTMFELSMVKHGAVIWGWMHCVQQIDVTQIAIDKSLTYISWEAMFSSGEQGEQLVHTFQKNNEIAGYAAVNHATSLVGCVGLYGQSSKVSVLSFGSVSRGAVYALKGLGYSDITVYTQRATVEVGNQIPGIQYQQLVTDIEGNINIYDEFYDNKPLIEVLSVSDLIINGTLQDIKQPKIFVTREDAGKLKEDSLIIDVSCDENMGFWCAKPTTFDCPIIKACGVNYYSVDHTPSFYWQSASWEISKALLPFLAIIAYGESEWSKIPTVANAVEVIQGCIINPQIINFQSRASIPPYLLQNNK